MGIVVRRVWRALGVLGLIGTIALPFIIIGAVSDPALVTSNPVGTVLLAGIVVVAFARFISQIRGYRRPQATKPYTSVVQGLVTSTEEFCLVLRPFGGDGEVFLRQYRTTRGGKKRIPYRLPIADLRTMEQVLALATQKTAKQKAYALVDQKRKLAPPGPVYLRASNYDWQEAIGPLMRRAYAVILWLPPDREGGPGLNWEIEQVVRDGLQTRTIIVLPPPDKKVAYQRAVKQAATLLATMETATGLAVHANPLRVQHYEGVLGSNTVTMKFVRARDGDGLRLIRRFAGDLPRLTWQQMLVNLPLLWGSPLVWDPRRKKRINALVYESGLASLLTIVGKELADQPFPVRYPSPEPGSAGEILSDPTRRTEYDRKLNAEVDPRSASGSDASDDPGSGEPPADDADEEPEAFNIRVAPQTIDFGIVKTGGPNVNAEVVLSWDGGSPNLIRRFPPGGDWWDIRDAASGIGRVTFKVSAQAYDGIPSGRHSSYFDIVVDDVVYRVGLVMAIIDSRKPNGRYTRTARRSPILASKEIFAYRVSWLLATVAALLISEYIEHFFNPTGSPSEVLVSIGGIWNLVIIIYGLCRTFRRNRLIVIPSSKKLWTFASFAVTIFIASIVLIWTYKNGISGWAS